MTVVLPAATEARTAADRQVEVRGVGLSFEGPRSREVLSDLTFSVSPGEFVCVVGPSGCGKTTLLRLLAGLLFPTSGEVLVSGQQIERPRRDVAMVFQDYGRTLCPWRSAVRNVELPLEARGVRRKERRRLAQEALGRVGLVGHDSAYPRQLSGGMQQRLQMARAVVQGPRVLLMDEPFASLDALTRFRLEDTTLGLWEDEQQTIVLVTHDLDEAVYLADRIILLNTGPASVVGEVLVDLPRPRDQAETRAHPRFVELRHELFRRIRDIEDGRGS